MAGQLEGKRIVVTGSSQGIGRAIACGLAREGARVAVNASGGGAGGGEEADRVLGALVEELGQLGGEGLACIGSVADFDAATAVIETAAESFGGLDGLVNCAGGPGAPTNSILEIEIEDWKHVLAVHLDGSFYCIRAAIPHLRRAGCGSIVNTSSHGHLGDYGGTAYPAAKGGINSLTFALATDLRSEGIRCNAVCPGAKTRLSSGPDYEQLIGRLESRGLLSTELAAASLDAPPPEECAPIYGYLLSDAASEITGRVFTTSGGYVGIFDRHSERMIGMHEAGAPAWTLEELAEIVPTKLEVGR
jgi:NAD(P)-dependent dehydrogenase (short-subunit alcohol dehydrogenase family)